MATSLVQLYCYDLSGGMAESMSLMLIGRHLEAIWHTGIVVYGKEYYFDGGVGIVHSSPGGSHFGTPKRVETLGTTTKGEGEFLEWVKQRRLDTFGPTHYNLLNRNCNHFTQAAAQFLVERDIPSEIRDMIPTVLDTPLGRMLKPMLEMATRGLEASAKTSQLSTSPRKKVSNTTETPTVSDSSTSLDVATGLNSEKSHLSVEEHEEVMLVRAMLQSNELLSSGTREGFNTTMGALILLRMVITNILRNPTQLKYRTLSTQDKEYKSKIAPLEEFGAADILRLCGFRLLQHPTLNQAVWFLSDADGSEDVLAIMVTHITELIELVESEYQSEFCAVEGDPNIGTFHKEKYPVPPLTSNASDPGDRAMEVIMHDAVKPISSLEDLMNWSPTSPGAITPAAPCRRRVQASVEDGPRLLICHDMKGGYLPTDYEHFAVCNRLMKGASALVPSVVNCSYTVSYWHHVDYFVYFSHNFVTVPPKEWISYAHREGVPALGTFITEGESLTLRKILHDAQSSASTIRKLVDLCDAHNFDGYLMNIETNLDETLAKRLITFVAMLKKSLNKSRPPNSGERFVFWYDAVTVEGIVSYQNGLTSKNKPFFDVCNGLFTNYGWRPYNLPLSTAIAGQRNRDVFVGVDIFGRGVYGGGGYDSHKAADCASGAKLSIAIFAPGWTSECVGNGCRENFQRHDAHMWSKMQDIWTTKYLELDTLPVWTCFLDEVGTQFFVNGAPVLGCVSNQNSLGSGVKCSNDDTDLFFPEWCQISQTHIKPCYKLVRGGAEGDPWCVLPFEVVGKDGCHTNKDGQTVPLDWSTKQVWMGNRSMSFAAPPNATVPLMRWKVRLEVGAADGEKTSDALAFLDIAWLCNAVDAQAHSVRCVCVEGVNGSSTTRVVFDEQLASPERIIVVATVGNWQIVRYVIPDNVTWTHVTCLSILNPSENESLVCTVGGVALTEPTYDNSTSVLLLGDAQILPSTSYTVDKTSDPTTCVVTLDVPNELRKKSNKVILFAKIGFPGGKLLSAYLGTHEISKQILLPLNIPSDAFVYEMFFYGSASGN